MFELLAGELFCYKNYVCKIGLAFIPDNLCILGYFVQNLVSMIIPFSVIYACFTLNSLHEQW